ncbi:glutathione S-transferase family protein [uncultured Maritimibacter sp.]|jgi:glutathione S-transferase|uniref:glutathione S-transferase family protein n=1 Tax=uncultured Maritimibacter sp. TaxID=991866 RepID=UPI00262853EF|nr:glutathione S-transferase family protein [uncultured Maritimibacter sp.]
MIKLYGYPKSTCTQKVKLCLFEKTLPFTDRPVDLAKQEHLTPEYLALNPNGVVPTLVHDGVAIHDSSVIMEYLDEVFPDVPMSGRTAVERARVRAWLRFFEEVPTVAIRIPSFAKVLLKPVEKMTPDERRANSDKRTLRKGFYRSMEDGISDARFDEAVERLRLTCERMEATLADRDWLVAGLPGGFGIADACVVPTFDRMQDLGLAPVWQDLPGVSHWWARVQERDCFARTYVDGTRLVAA